MRRAAAVAFCFFLLAAWANAQVPTSGNVFFGYSYYNTDLSGFGRSNMNGWQGSLEGKVLPAIGIVADLSGTYGSESIPLACPAPVCGNQDINVHEYNVLFGPRFSISAGKVRPFVEFEFGVGHVTTNGTGSDTSFATAVGGGLDYKIVRPLAWRFEGDYVTTRFFGTSQNNARISTGLVLRF